MDLPQWHDTEEELADGRGAQQLQRRGPGSAHGQALLQTHSEQLLG